MLDSGLLTRVTSRPDVFGGKPVIRDMRISVEMILSLLEQGESDPQSWLTTLSWSQRTSERASTMPGDSSRAYGRM